MFGYDMAQTKHFTRKADSVESYRQWLLAVGIDEDQFPFSVKTGRFYKNKPINFHVASWGAYIGNSGEWIVFIAYGFDAMRHSIQYSWLNHKDGKVTGNPVKREWIN